MCLLFTYHEVSNTSKCCNRGPDVLPSVTDMECLLYAVIMLSTRGQQEVQKTTPHHHHQPMLFQVLVLYERKDIIGSIIQQYI